MSSINNNNNIIFNGIPYGSIDEQLLYDLYIKQKPVVYEQKPVVNEQKPVVNEQKPVVYEQKPVVHEQKPVVHEQKPVTLEKKADLLPEQQASLLIIKAKEHADILMKEAQEKVAILMKEAKDAGKNVVNQIVVYDQIVYDDAYTGRGLIKKH